jgi:hypothetical protein
VASLCCEPASLTPFLYKFPGCCKQGEIFAKASQQNKVSPNPSFLLVFPSLVFFYLVISLHLIRTSRCKVRSEICKFQIGICIGRSDDCAHDEWFLTVTNATTHNDHPPPETSLLRKPARLHTPADLEIVKDAIASYAGVGVARSLYFYRTGEVLLDYSMLHRLKSIKITALCKRAVPHMN